MTSILPIIKPVHIHPFKRTTGAVAQTDTHLFEQEQSPVSKNLREIIDSKAKHVIINQDRLRATLTPLEKDSFFKKLKALGIGYESETAPSAAPQPSSAAASTQKSLSDRSLSPTPHAMGSSIVFASAGVPAHNFLPPPIIINAIVGFGSNSPAAAGASIISLLNPKSQSAKTNEDSEFNEAFLRLEKFIENNGSTEIDLNPFINYDKFDSRKIEQMVRYCTARGIVPNYRSIKREL